MSRVLYTGERAPGTHWMSPRAGLNTVEKKKKAPVFFQGIEPWLDFIN
jgi:hypothetical protein